MNRRGRIQTESGLSDASSHLIEIPYLKDKSINYYKRSRVSSCNYVMMESAGVPKAIPFYKKQQFQEPSDPLTYQISVSHQTYKKKYHDYAGSILKKLTPYSPDAQRNRLANIVLPQINSNYSQIDLTEGVQQIELKQNIRSKQFKPHSIYKDSYGNFSNLGLTENPAIISMKTKQHRRKINL